MVDFGPRLRALRNEKRLTQLQLAEQIGVTKSVISAYESSLRSPACSILIKIARVFGVTTDYLLGLSQNLTIDVSGLADHEIQTILKMIDVFKSK